MYRIQGFSSNVRSMSANQPSYSRSMLAKLPSHSGLMSAVVSKVPRRCEMSRNTHRIDNVGVFLGGGSSRRGYVFLPQRAILVIGSHSKQAYLAV